MGFNDPSPLISQFKMQDSNAYLSYDVCNKWNLIETAQLFRFAHK